MVSPFRVEAQAIERLDALALTRLLKRLLHLEAQSSGIAQRSVEVALNISVPDGGEDGRINWTEGPAETDYLPNRLVQFQCKATELGPTACAEEIVAKDGSVKPMVDAVLSAGGAYVVFTTQMLNQHQKEERVDAIRAKLCRIGAPYATSATIKCYDASAIEGWVNKYIPAVVYVKNITGDRTLADVMTWAEWESLENGARFPFVKDDERERVIEALRKLTDSSRNVIRVIGFSGLGKTRLALEAFRPIGGQADTASSIAYIDAAISTSDLPGLIASWIREGMSGVLVVDNCSIGLHKKLRQQIQRAESKLSLLTLDSEPEHDQGCPEFVLSTMQPEHISQMLTPMYSGRIPDLQRIVSFAQGWPQMAVLLAQARLDREPEMGSLKDDDILRRILWSGGPVDVDHERVLRALSLFDAFGIDDDAQSELHFICETLIHSDVDTVYDCVQRFRKRGVVNVFGRFAQIAPKPLAIRLAAEWWRSVRRETQQALISSDLPGRLMPALCAQIEKLDFLPEVKSLTEELCGASGPFGQAEVILSETGSYLFRAFAEINPEATTRAIGRVLLPLDESEVVAIDGDTRRNLVWALEKLCFRKVCFQEAAICLLRLAVAETENYSNNATGNFTQLFRVFGSGTEATPEQRLSVIEVALGAACEKATRIAIMALSAALEVQGRARLVGAEYQGSGPPLEEWRPVYWQEVFDYWGRVLDTLKLLAQDTNLEVAKAALNGIGTKLRGLVSKSRDITYKLDSIIEALTHSGNLVWTSAFESVVQALKYDAEKMPVEAKDMLEKWSALLVPRTLPEQLEFIVTRPIYDHSESSPGKFVDRSALRAEALAQKVSEDWAALQPHLKILMSGEQRQSFAFGRTLSGAVLNDKGSRFNDLIAAAVDIEDLNANFLCGVLRGIFEADKGEWNARLDKLKDTTLRSYYADFVQSGEVEPSHLKEIEALLRQGVLKTSSVVSLSYGRGMEHLDSHVVNSFCQSLLNLGGENSWAGFEIIMRVEEAERPRSEEKWARVGEFLLKVDLKQESPARASNLHLWCDAAKHLIEAGDVGFSTKLAIKILEAASDVDDFELIHQVRDLLGEVLEKHGDAVWPEVCPFVDAAISKRKIALAQLFSVDDFGSRSTVSPIGRLPKPVFEAWCRASRAGRVFSAEVLNPLSAEAGETTLASRLRFLIDEFGDDEEILGAVGANLSTFGWMGSVVPHLQKEIAALRELIPHRIKHVQEWAEWRIEWLSRRVQREARYDDEWRQGIY